MISTSHFMIIAHPFLFCSEFLRTIFLVKGKKREQLAQKAVWQSFSLLYSCYFSNINSVYFDLIVKSEYSTIMRIHIDSLCPACFQIEPLLLIYQPTRRQPWTKKSIEFLNLILTFANGHDVRTKIQSQVLILSNQTCTWNQRGYW